MDGQQGAVRRSLQQDLNRWIMVFCAVFALLAGTLSGILVFHEAQELQDLQLEQIGALINHDRAAFPNKIVTGTENHEDIDEQIIVQLLIPDSAYPQTLPVPADLKDGFYTLNLKGMDWRIFVMTTQKATRYAIAQNDHLRDELAFGSAASTTLPLLLLAPLLMLMVHFMIAYSFRPIRELSEHVDQRKENDLTPLTDDHIPHEITPFVNSINQLLQRSGQLLTQQRRFVADAAHELRTPLTALSLLTENLSRAGDMQAVQERLVPLQESMTRMQTLVSQLLNLARIQGKQSETQQAITFLSLVQQIMVDLYPLAEAKQIDLGINRKEEVSLLDQNGGLNLLVRNALDNAIRYTPAGGQIDIDLFTENGEAVLRICDTGQGIPEKELTQVFEPFHRAKGTQEAGNGLGLTISQEVAQQLGGSIHLQNRQYGGLEFCYRQHVSAPS